MKQIVFLLSLLLFSSCFTTKEYGNETIETQKKEYFTVEPSVLKNGDSTLLVKWSMNTDSVFLNGLKCAEASGFQKFVVDTTSLFILDVVRSGQKERYEKKIVYTPKINEKSEISKLTNVKKKNDHVYSEGEFDGRFTIGTEDGYRLMYGFPIPISTSHFVFAVNDTYASNGTNLKTIDSTNIYFRGNIDTSKMEYSGINRTEIEFMLDSVVITQIIQPVSAKLKPVKKRGNSNFLHITYKIENFSKEEKKIGLMVLMDMMIDDNDSAYTYIKNKKILNETSFSGVNMPNKFHSLRTAGKFKELHATTLFSKKDTPLPDTISIGNWPHFHNVTWNIVPDSSIIGDNAYLLKWNKRNLKSKATQSFSFHLGIDNKKVNLIFDNSTDVIDESITLHYPKLGQTTLNNTEKIKLKKFYDKFKDKEIYGIIIEGYSDALGATNTNSSMSLKRAKSVKRFFLLQGVKSSKIAVKGFGESAASQSEESIELGSLNDRKVKVAIYYQK